MIIGTLGAEATLPESFLANGKEPANEAVCGGSEAETRAHEMGHAEQDLDGIFDNAVSPLDPSWDADVWWNDMMAQEEAVVIDPETVIANELGEATRDNYSDVLGSIRTIGPTSNQIQFPFP